MKHTLVFMHIFAVLLAAQNRRPEESTESIIERLRKNPAETGLVGDLAKRSADPLVIPALRELFVQAKLSGARDQLGFRASQVIAATLFKAGVTDQSYFDELAKYARDAIEADPPEAYLMDAEGNVDTARRSAAFENWCAARSTEFNACTAMAVAYVMDLSGLRAAHDSRAIPLFRAALKTSAVAMVSTATAGLAELDDVTSIPLIAQACARFPPVQAGLVVVFAMSFDDPAVLALFERCIQDPKERQSVKKEWHEKHDTPPAAPDRPR